MSELIHPELVTALEVLAAKAPGARMNLSLHDVPVAAFTDLAGVSVLRVSDGRLVLAGHETQGDLTVRCYSVDLPQPKLPGLDAEIDRIAAKVNA